MSPLAGLIPDLSTPNDDLIPFMQSTPDSFHLTYSLFDQFIGHDQPFISLPFYSRIIRSAALSDRRLSQPQGRSFCILRPSLLFALIDFFFCMQGSSRERECSPYLTVMSEL